MGDDSDVKHLYLVFTFNLISGSWHTGARITQHTLVWRVMIHVDASNKDLLPSEGLIAESSLALGRHKDRTCAIVFTIFHSFMFNILYPLSVDPLLEFCNYALCYKPIMIVAIAVRRETSPISDPGIFEQPDFRLSSSGIS